MVFPIIKIMYDLLILYKDMIYVYIWSDISSKIII